MNIGKGSSKLPHSLRIVILLLRLAIGLSFFYAISFNDLHTPEQWAFFIIGALLIVGLFTRVASIAGIAFLVYDYWPNVTSSAINVPHLVNDQLILMICLLILIFANAGKYIGLDMFIRFRTGRNKE